MRTCSLCPNKHLARGYCQVHYQRWQKRGDANAKVLDRESHSATRTPEYLIWQSMKGRCYTKNNTGYPWYGARGIKVCDEWQVFSVFIADMGLRPTPKHTLDRIDNNGNYEPSNCRWVLRQVQSYNKRTTVKYQGKTYPEWAKILKVSKTALASLVIRHNWEYAINFYTLNQKAKDE